jgi:RNA polymerase sigma factor (sigma-70 family)
MPEPIDANKDADPAPAQSPADDVKALLERHLPEVEAFVRIRAAGLWRAKESPQDLAQSVCREILEHADRFRHPDEDGFRRWLFTEVARKIAERETYFRREKRDIGREVDVRGRPSDSGAEQSMADIYRSLITPSRDAIAREDLERFETAFAAMPDDYREVVTMSRIMGLSHAEIAGRLGRTEGAVRKLLVRALATLTGLMDKK